MYNLKELIKNEFTRTKNDINGNPRYIVHYPLFIKTSDNVPVEKEYDLAVKRAKTIGGKKYRGKNYGGGIVFQSYSLEQLANSIIKLMTK